MNLLIKAFFRDKYILYSSCIIVLIWFAIENLKGNKLLYAYTTKLFFIVTSIEYISDTIKPPTILHLSYIASIKKGIKSLKR